MPAANLVLKAHSNSDRANMSYALGIKALALLALGHRLDARNILLGALHHAASASPSRRASHECILGAMDLWPGNPNEAIQHCGIALELALKTGATRVVYRALVRQAIAEIAAHLYSNAEEHLRQAHAFLIKNNLTDGELSLRYDIGMAFLSARSNRVPEALELLRAAEESIQAHPVWSEPYDFELIEATRRMCTR